MGQVVEHLPTKHKGRREVRRGRGGDGTCGSIWKQEESLPGEVEARYQETGKSSYSSLHIPLLQSDIIWILDQSVQRFS
jgi:hypothetical protein